MSSYRNVLSFAGLALGVGLAVAQPGGFGPLGGEERKLVKDFDKNADGWLNAEERKPARAAAKQGARPGKFGPPGGMGGRGPETKPGPKVAPADVKNYPDAPLYDPGILRTIFVDFENADWESELEDFHNTDVEVPATLTVDGKTYPNVGVHFRGMSSYMGMRAGQKRSLNLSLDLADDKQRLYGFKTLNLLNAHEDPSFLSTVLYSNIARKYTAAPKANFVKVVVNGESWGVYTSVQQFNKDFLKENYKSTKGTRWKVRGSPGGRGGLEYTGDDVADYKRRFEIKTKDDPKAWEALIRLCKTLNQTPADKLEAALKPMLDVDSTLWFLALDVALCNMDGYWTRASDYTIFLDESGKFHIVPHDMNEAFKGGGGFGPGGGGGGRPGGGGGRPGGAGGPGGGGPGGAGGGPGGFTFPFPRPGELLPLPMVDELKLNDAQKKELADLQKETDAKLEKLLTDAQRKQWKEIRERGPGGMVGGFGPPGGGMGGGGVTLDPLVGLDNARTPLRGKLLAVPAWRTQYLKNVRTIAEESLDWKNLGPTVDGFKALIGKEVAADTRKLTTTEAFEKATADTATGTGREMSLKAFAEQRKKYLLDNAEIKKLPAK